MTQKKPICVGAGLVALDIILNCSPKTLPKMSVGGSCGNVLTILSFLGWESLPVARLANNRATSELLNDLSRWHVNESLLTVTDSGSTPIIIHRILKDKNDTPIHKFEFRDPDSKDWLPSFKPITINIAHEIIERAITPKVFYFDRVNPGTLQLAQHYRDSGALVFFEPSSNKDERQFNKALSIAHVVKFSNDRISDYHSKYEKNQTELEIETQGKDGIVYRTSKSKQWKRVKPYNLGNIYDTAGAGDWTSAGVILKLAEQGYSSFSSKTATEIEQALQYGQLLAGLNCLFDGARGLMYYFSQSSFKRIVANIVDQQTTITSNYLTSYKRTPIDNSIQTKISALY